MIHDYKENDYAWIQELMQYPHTLDNQLVFFEDTSQIQIPKDPIEQVVFQDKAKAAINLTDPSRTKRSFLNHKELLYLF